MSKSRTLCRVFNDVMIMVSKRYDATKDSDGRHSTTHRCFTWLRRIWLTSHIFCITYLYIIGKRLGPCSYVGLQQVFR